MNLNRGILKIVPNKNFFKKEEEVKLISLLVFGDLMLDRYVRSAVQTNGQNFPFLKIEKVLGGNDLVLANLEGSFTDFSPKPLDPDNMIFTFDPKLVPFLGGIGFNLFSLANNHTLNFGEVGLSQSKRYLTRNRIDYFGDPKNESEISIVEDIKGLKIGFVGYNESGSAGFNRVIEETKKIKGETDFTIVYAHWGVEYQTQFSQKQQQEARKVVDAGADLIIGSHPHVIQPIELYKNKLIFYSLGNFLFDQTFSQKTQQGLGIKLVFSQSQIACSLFPIQTKNLQVSLLEGKEREAILKELSSRSQVTENIRKQIIQGRIIFSSEDNSR